MTQATIISIFCILNKIWNTMLHLSRLKVGMFLWKSDCRPGTGFKIQNINIKHLWWFQSYSLHCMVWYIAVSSSKMEQSDHYVSEIKRGHSNHFYLLWLTCSLFLRKLWTKSNEVSLRRIFSSEIRMIIFVFEILMCGWARGGII